MKASRHAALASDEIHRAELANRIRQSYHSLLKLLPSAYVDGEEVFRALTALGFSDAAGGPSRVRDTLGCHCMGLPVANIQGKAKFYFPRVVRSSGNRKLTITEQVSIFNESLHPGSNADAS